MRAPTPLAATLVLALLGGCPTGPVGWQDLGEELDAALLSISGTTTDDVWAVGADAGDGPLVVHWDGSAWSTEETGTSGDLWWVHLVGTTEAWMVGAGGRVLHLDRTTGSYSEEVLDDAITFFGVWTGGDGVVWAVGGDISAGGSSPALWRRDESGWAEQPLPAEAQDVLALYKVWGSSPDDVWICGANGLLLHWDGVEWASTPSPSARTLFTVSGTGPDDVYAVGGFGEAEAVRWDGASWSDVSPEFIPQFNGVTTRGDEVVAVGRTGAVYWRDADTWVADERGPATDYDLHAGWLDPDGGLWAVGGAIVSLPLDRGVVVYGGPERPGAITQ